jgi:hypothetical protein
MVANAVQGSGHFIHRTSSVEAGEPDSFAVRRIVAAIVMLLLALVDYSSC